jgi:2-amino-4-hydroxy-6-hydroxymethyldihydropteridine diphosphokinase
MKAWLGLGSNLQQPVAQLRDAISRLGEVDDINVLRISGFYRTPPWGDESQDDFINAVVQIETGFDALPLLHELQLIEKEMGRQRIKQRRWGPRLIDIDLLLYENRRIQSGELEVPHPRMHERAFVLVPLCELDAALEIPGRGVADKLLSKIDVSGIFRLPEGALEP